MSLPAPLAMIVGRLQQAWRERTVALKALSFALVGVINTSIDAGVFFLTYALLTSSPAAAGFTANVRLVIANVVAWTVAVSCSYILNSYITFAAESGRKLRLRAYATFIVSGLLGLLANTATLIVTAQFLPVWAAKACAILVSFMVNFSMSHFVVFRRRSESVGH